MILRKINVKYFIFLIIFLFITIMSYFFYKQNENKVIKKEAKIIATLGYQGWKMIENYNKNGANIFRINGSHIKSSNDLRNLLAKVNDELKKSNYKNTELMYDTQGPEIRVRIISNNNAKNVYYKIKQNDSIIVHTDLNSDEIVFKKDINRNADEIKTIHIGVNYDNFVNDVKVGSGITIENRDIYAKVVKINKKQGIVELKITEITTKDKEYKLTDRRHINLLGAPVSQPTLTNADKEYITTSVLAGVKYYAISFVRDENDIIEVRNLIANAFKSFTPNIKESELKQKMEKIKIIAKIETRQGLDNIEKIVQVADGAMVARGDLSSEIPQEEVPYAKEKIISTCNKYGKFSILATNVLESLTYKNSASMNDIDVMATALQLGVDALMLSNETAIGERGVDAIREMKKHIEFHKKHS